MPNQTVKRIEKLGQLAEQDAIYNAWFRSYREYQAVFESYANVQPDEIRNMLWGYAESGRRMYQRITILACQHMTFTDIEKEMDKV